MSSLMPALPWGAVEKEPLNAPADVRAAATAAEQEEQEDVEEGHEFQPLSLAQAGGLSLFMKIEVG